MAETIRDFLFNSATPDNLLGASGAAVFALNLPGGEDEYAMRVSKSGYSESWDYSGPEVKRLLSGSNKLKQALESTTSLTPPEHVFGYRSIGQPLLQMKENGVNLSLLVRQKGVGYGDYVQAKRDEYYQQGVTYPEDKTRLAVLKDINALPIDHLERALEGICLAEKNFVGWDTGSMNNLMFDPKHGFSTIDHGYPSDPPDMLSRKLSNSKAALDTAANTLLAMIMVHERSSGELPDEFEWGKEFARESQTFLENFEKARENVEARLHTPPLNKNPHIKVNQVDAVALSAPPQKLLEQLRAVEREASIQR